MTASPKKEVYYTDPAQDRIDFKKKSTIRCSCGEVFSDRDTFDAHIADYKPAQMRGVPSFVISDAIREWREEHHLTGANHAAPAGWGVIEV